MSSGAPQFARMPWYPRDFMASTRGWPLIAEAVYRKMLDWQWDLGGAEVGTLPEDPERLRMVVGATPEEWGVAWSWVESKFPIVDGGRRNARLEEHRAEAVRRLKLRQRAGEAGARARWGDPKVQP